MKIAIHQPEHFPYEGFFQKMRESDLFIILDNVKFRKNYFQNRNKFLSKKGEEEWFGVAVPKNSNSLFINKIVPVDNKINNWKSKTIKQIFNNFSTDLTRIYDQEKLIEINMSSIEWCRNKLKIETPMLYASSLNVVGEKSDLLLSICKEVNATTYLSGPSGKDYLEQEIFRCNNIKVDFFNPVVKNYYSMIYNILN